MKIVTLMENSSFRDDLTAEHGLSLYIEANGKRILFDAGQSDAFADNADALGVNLSGVDLAVLSHGHYDHSGGLLRFLERNHHAPIYISHLAFSPCYHGEDRYIGIDPTLSKSGRLIYCNDFTDLGCGLSLHSCNQKKRSYPTDSFGLTVLHNGIYEDDLFLHEQYLLIEENGKRVLISGCSHKGILNIADWFSPDVLIGGFHFMNLDPETSDAQRLQLAADTLLQHPTTYYTGHCTGSTQFEYMKQRMGDRLYALSCGSCIDI